MTIGRPTKYSKAILAKANDYLANYKTVYGDEIPSVVGLSLVLDIRRNTLYDWASQGDKEEFSNILEKINEKQHQVLISNGLNGSFNAQITKLVLGKHGYHDKQETDHKSSDGTMSPPQVIEIVAKDQSQD